MSKTDTPETSEAWDAVTRTPDGIYDTSIPMTARAYTMLDHARRLERERDALRKDHEKLTGVIHAATVLIAAKGRHNTILAYEGLRAAIASDSTSHD